MKKVKSGVILSLVLGMAISLVFPALLLAEEVPEKFQLPAEPEGGLEFEEVEVTELSETRAVVLVDLNSPAYGKVSYGPGDRLEHELSMMRGKKQHRFVLEDLVEGTVYNFQVRAWVDQESEVETRRMQFRTTGTPPPELRSVEVKERTGDGALLEWRTNIPVKAGFKAGHDSGKMKFRTTHPVAHTRHQVKLEGFYPDRNVYYRIDLEDSRGRTKTSDVRRFRTRENNIAWQQPVEGTFDQPPFGVDATRIDTGERFVERITNGVTNYTEGTATSGDPDQETQWFIVDLGDTYRLDRVEIYWRAHAYPESYRLGLYAERERPVAEKEGLNAADGEKIYSEGGLPAVRHVVDLSDVEAAARLIRVEIPRGAPYYTQFPQFKFVQLIDFKVFPETGYQAAPEATKSGAGGSEDGS